jgi:hypothetical protein
LTGKITIIDFDPSETIESLKAKIEVREGITTNECNKFRLIY